jgi:hypothetical protein
MTENNKINTRIKNKNRWISILIFNFCIVAFLGFVLRSKIVFSLPSLDYNRLLDAHFHFAFGAWVTLAIAVLFIYELLPSGPGTGPVYRWVPIGILASSWLLLIVSPLPANSPGASICSVIFILATYVFSWSVISGIRRAPVSRTVKLLAISALVCLVLSSSGIFALAYLFATKSFNPFAYRDALYTYLHFTYNGFFTLGVFALLFHKLDRKMTAGSKQKAFHFSLSLVISTVPSLFLTYLWRDPNEFYHIIAICGTVTLLFAFILFVRLAFSLREAYMHVPRLIRRVGYISMISFAFKIFLQSFTLFPAIGNAVFGDRPVIIGFLHLVFLGFVTLFLMSWFAYHGFLNMKYPFTRFALIIFTIAIVLNEGVLMTQGLGVMFTLSSHVIPWVLWSVSIALLTGALLIAIARIRSGTVSGL